MNKKEQKKVTNRIIKELLKEETDTEIFYVLSELYEKASTKNQKDFEDCDISHITKKEYSQEEVNMLRKSLISVIDKELRKKHSLLITTRLLLAQLQLDTKIKKKNMNKRAKICYRYIKNSTMFADEERILTVIRDLANL